MAIMSFSNAPDANILARVAGALAVDEAFVEKDWYVVQAIAALIASALPMLQASAMFWNRPNIGRVALVWSLINALASVAALTDLSRLTGKSKT